MKNSVFDYSDYKSYLKDKIGSRPAGGHGIRIRIAEALHCHAAYVSQVLNKDVNFSLEQSEDLNGFFGHNKEEGHYFLLLVQLARAGTLALRKRLSDEKSEILKRRLNLKDRVDIKTSLSIQDQALYYSAWYYAAIHLLLSIPEYQTKEALSDYLGFSLERITEVLDFLISVGLAKIERGRYKIGVARIFLGSDSPMISKHHTNWRIKAVEVLERASNADLHFSTIVSLAKGDVQKIKEQLVKDIEAARAVVKDSKEEEVHCLALDFFKI